MYSSYLILKSINVWWMCKLSHMPRKWTLTHQGVPSTSSISCISSYEKRSTKTVARCFTPEFSHFFDIALPLILSDHILQKKPQQHPYIPTSTRVSLAEKISDSNMIIEIWHQVPGKDSRPGPVPVDGRPFGRRLGPTFKDVLLGYVEIPLIQLLQRHTGKHNYIDVLVAKHSS